MTESTEIVTIQANDIDSLISCGKNVCAWDDCTSINMFVPNDTNTHKINIGGFEIKVPILEEYVKYSIIPENLFTIFLYEELCKFKKENSQLQERISKLEIEK